ncbi:hypothetical protein FZEAL_2481 [Fusarium zealandicum]|uniref:Nephrocystin 3-like N-terminal domain-containing protein n=1 Tax=Fusarium zealandicum TaxID=1053134 RepID=A0A8H4XNT9_9HYPO|nr:hypothetical protein FZEAL_2481 [Fusarium zealandicum]
MDSSDRFNLLSNLCPGDTSAARQKALDEARLPGSGQWFLDDPRAQAWLSSQSTPLLWLQGQCATGKTFLSSRVVNHIRAYAAAAVCYFDKCHKLYNIADHRLAFRSVARQLVSQLPPTSAILQKLNTTTLMPLGNDNEIFLLLKEIASELDKVFIILDGVEAAAESGLHDLVAALAGDDGQISSFQVLITSRSLPSTEFINRQGVSVIEACASNLDLEQYITTSIRDASAETNSPEQKDIDNGRVSDLVHSLDGVFLPLPMPLDRSKSTSDTLSNLEELITASSGASLLAKSQSLCNKIVTQIRSTKWSKMALCMLYHLVKIGETSYSFTLPMACEALDAWGIYQDDGNSYTTKTIAEYCCSLISVSDESQVMRIKSPLFEEYLRHKEFGIDYHEQNITASMQYLAKDEFSGGACSSSGELKRRFQDHRYLWYAARMLSTNLAGCFPGSFAKDFVQLSSLNGSIESYLQAAEAWPYLDEATYNELEASEERWTCFQRGYRPLHLAALLAGPASLISALVERGEEMEARVADGQTALHIAAETGDKTSALQALLELGSNVAAVDNCGETPFSIAVVHGSKESVKLLLDYGADIGAVDDEVLRECVRENPDVARYLTDQGVGMPVDEDDSS